MNNFHHYLQTTKNINFKYNKNTPSKKESRQKYGYIPAKNLILSRSQKFKTNLVLFKKNASEKGQLILLENGDILEVKRNTNGLLKINKKKIV